MHSIYPDNPNGMNIEWVLSNVCNYKCSYCREDLYGGSSGQPHYEKALDFFNYLHKDVQPGPKLLNLTGGEPTVWPRLIPFLNELHKSYFVQITTNGSRTINWWNKLLSKCDNISRVCISTHLEFADIEHIYKVGELLHQKVQLTILLLADRKNFDIVRQYSDKFKNLECSVFIKPIRDYTGKAQDYTEEEKEFIKNYEHSTSQFGDLPVPTHLVVDGEHKSYRYGYKIISNNEHQFKGWKCGLGKTRIVIWHNGNISLAQCSTAKKMKLGNIYENNYSIPEKPVICQTDFCACIPDLRIPKWKDDNVLA